MSSAASGINFLPNLMIPRAPKAGSKLEDAITWMQGAAAALEQFRVLWESQTESFISSSAYIGDLVVANAHIQDLAVTTAKLDNLAVTSAKIADASIITAKINNLAVVTAKIDNLTVTTIKRQLTNAVFAGYTASANSDAYVGIATGVNGTVTNFRSFPMNLKQSWSGASTSQTYLGLLYEAAADDYYANLHNGTNTSVDFSFWLDWW